MLPVPGVGHMPKVNYKEVLAGIYGMLRRFARNLSLETIKNINQSAYGAY